MPSAALDAADATHGAGWPLSGVDCENEEGRLVSCSDKRSVGAPVRTVYRPSVKGVRQTRIYLEPDDPAIAAATSDRAHRIPIRRGERGDASFAFGGARAAGGRVQAGRSYLVGEKGPEMFVPDRDGRIEPKPEPFPWVAVGVGVAAVVGLVLVFRAWRRRSRRRARRRGTGG